MAALVDHRASGSSFHFPFKMATTTALSPDSSAAGTGNPILGFVRSLLFYLLDVLHRALKSVSRNRKSNSNPNKTPSPPPASQIHPAASASFSIEHQQKHYLSRLATTPTSPPPTRMQPTKVMPAVPLLPPPVGVPSPEKNTKENSLASPGNVAHALPQQLHSQDPTRSNLADITASLARLGTVDVNGGIGDDSGSLSPTDATSTTGSIPVSLPCPPLPISESLTGEAAVHSGFMREALDMVRPDLCEAQYATRLFTPSFATHSIKGAFPCPWSHGRIQRLGLFSSRTVQAMDRGLHQLVFPCILQKLSP